MRTSDKSEETIGVSEENPYGLSVSMKTDTFPLTPPWERTHATGMFAMEELLGEKYGMIGAPETPKVIITPRGEKIIPVRVARRMSAPEIGGMRMHMEPDQINEFMVSKLLPSLLEELDEMGLIDLQINQVNPETLEYSIRLDVVKHE